MTPQEIIDAYNVLAEDVKTQSANDAAKVGNSQRSLGTLAAAVASPSGQTSGLANYTYNRLMRPSVDTATAALVTRGKAQALETQLTNELLAAKQNYENSKNRYTASAGSGSGSGNGNGGGKKETTDLEFWGGPVNEVTAVGKSAYDQLHDAMRQYAQNAQKQQIYEMYKKQYENGEIDKETWDRVVHNMVYGN